MNTLKELFLSFSSAENLDESAMIKLKGGIEDKRKRPGSNGAPKTSKPPSRNTASKKGY